MSKLNWIVPARRLVVEENIEYADLIAAWVKEIVECKTSLTRWYEISETQLSSGVEMIKFWHQAFFRKNLPVHGVREGEVTVDSPPFNLFVRLWSGPFRVLLENEHAEELIGAKWFESEQVFHQGTSPWPEESIERPQEPRRQTPAGQVINADAVFLTGDVVEFPLWKMLGGCGLSKYGVKPDFENVMEFFPEGSYLLGNSVVASGGKAPPSNAPLHDNRVAMRFMSMLGVFRAGFYHLDEKVYDDKFYDSGKAVKASVSVPITTQAMVEAGTTGKTEDHTVFARGMMYAAVINGPRWAPYKKPMQDNIRLFTSAWCKDVDKFDPPRTLPTRESLDLLPKKQPMTPGGVCSDTLLWLTNFISKIDSYSWTAKGGSVSHTMAKKTGYHINDWYDRLESSAVEAWAPEFTKQEKLDHLDSLIDELQSLYDLIVGETALWNTLWEAAVQQFESDPLLPSLRDLMQGSKYDKLAELAPKTKPNSFMQKLGYAILSKKTKSDAKTALRTVHRGIADGIGQWAEAMDEVIASKSWIVFGTEGKSATDFEPYLEKMRGQSSATSSGPKDRHGMFEAYQIRFKLRSKLKSLNKLKDNPDKIKTSRGGQLKLDSELSDINVISVSGHEWGIVRVKPFRHLLESEKLPIAGYIAAFEPLSGADCCPDSAPKTGQFYVFEESGSALRKNVEDNDGGKKHSLMGCTPFNWYKVLDNTFEIMPHSGGIRFNALGGSTRKKTLKSITKLKPKPEKEHDSVLDQLYNDPAEVYMPVFMHPHLEHWKTSVGKKAFARFVTNGGILYASRALPYPALNEWKGVLPNAEDVYPMLDKLKLKGKKAEESG